MPKLPKQNKKVAACPSPAVKPGGLAAKIANVKAERQAVSVPHVEVSALAGTGKTTTIVEGMAEVKGHKSPLTPSPQQRAVWDMMKVGKADTMRFNAFGRDIARALKDKLSQRGLDRQGCEASTFHSLGMQCINRRLGRFEASEWAVKNRVEDMLGVPPRSKQAAEARPLVNAVDAVVSLCKQNLVDPTDANIEEAIDVLADHYGVELDGVDLPRLYQLVPEVMEDGKNPRKQITFDDMIWLPLVLDLPVAKADVQIIDEAQDLNRMQQALAYRGGHRLVFVGDPHQAIYGFAGADSESMARMRAELGNCVTLPLTVTRRCGKAIVQEARQWVPEFEAHESNPAGRVDTLAWNDEAPNHWLKSGLVTDGTFVLCRVNAPLVNQCFKLLREGVKANILGRDVGKGLKQLVGKLAGPRGGMPVVEFVAALSDWADTEIAKENAKRNPRETKIQAVTDKQLTLTAFADGCQTTEDVCRKIDSVFVDNPGRGVTFSSIHKAKGLEADRVFYLQPPETPGTPGLGWFEAKLKAWEVEQENNLRYVAVTRAKEELIYVR